MAESLSPEVEKLVQEQIDGQRFTSANDVLLVALRLFEEYQNFQGRYRKQLGEQIKQGFDQIDRGEGIELEDENALRAFFDDIQRRGRERYEASQSA